MKNIDGSPVLPSPGRYTLAESQCGLPACWVDVIGPSACGGMYFDAVFSNSYMRFGQGIRRTIRVAIDGSWRDASTLLPVNCYGEVCQ